MIDIQKIAEQAGFDPHDMSDDFTCNIKDIKRFAALYREAVVQELVAGEVPVIKANSYFVGPVTFTVDYYTADQLAGAVAREMERAAKKVENYCGAWDDQGYALAQAIRSDT